MFIVYMIYIIYSPHEGSAWGWYSVKSPEFSQFAWEIRRIIAGVIGD